MVLTQETCSHVEIIILLKLLTVDYSLLCCCLVAKSTLTCLQSHGLLPARLFCPWDFSGKNTGVGHHFLLQEIFPIQGLFPSLADEFFTTKPLGSPVFTIIHSIISLYLLFHLIPIPPQFICTLLLFPAYRLLQFKGSIFDITLYDPFTHLPCRSYSFPFDITVYFIYIF